MAQGKWIADAQITTLFNSGADLNALANGSGVLESAGFYDNSSNLNYGFAFEFRNSNAFGAAPTANSFLSLYVVVSNDGTNYADTTAGASPFAPADGYLGDFQLEALTTSKRRMLTGVSTGELIKLPPLKCKFFLINSCGQALPATGNTVKMVAYRWQVV